MQTETEMRQVQIKQNSVRQMHKYVWILVGVFTLIAASFPTALMRVSKDKKFAAYNFHLKSLTLEGELPKPSSPSLATQPVANNSSAQTKSGGNMDKTHNPSSAATASQKSQVVDIASPTAEITETKELAALNQKLYDKIAQNWQVSNRKFEQKLEYRVSVRPDGAIASYEPLNQAASDYLQQTPVPNLLVSSVSDSSSTQKEPFGRFRVVFTRSGILEVSPWHGWSR